MQEPFVFVTTHTINDGKREEVEALSESFSDFVESNEPDVLAFEFFVDDDGRTVSNVQVHPDAASMERHLQLSGEQIGRALAVTQTRSIDVYGMPGPVLRTVLDHNVEAGVQVSIMPNRQAGFARMKMG